MPGFEFKAPTTLDEALTLFAQQGTVRALAGGSDVIDQLKTGRRHADLVVDIKRIPELQRLELADDGLHIGAARCCTDVHHHSAVRLKYAGLADACGLIGSVQIQNRAAVGGNVCNAAPSADTTPALLAHDARAIVASRKGRRDIPLTDFFAGPGQTVLQKGEILQEIVLPIPSANSASAYLRFIPRNEMDIAVAGVGSYIEIDPESRVVRKARIALASVAPTPVRAHAAEAVLEGRQIDERLIAEAGDAAVQAATPITDVRGSAEYRRELVKVLTRRTLNICLDRISVPQNGRGHS
ncbi:MAG: xanthine dehydrogenase family protein subunit M [Dehalococcoidia bacterium]